MDENFLKLEARITALEAKVFGVSPVPPTPTVPAPTASLSITPDTINAGEQALLNWETTGATSVILNGKAVEKAGQMTVTEAGVYILNAAGEGGSMSMNANLTVNHPNVLPANP